MTTIRTSDGVNVLPEDIVYYPKSTGFEYIVGEMSAGNCMKNNEYTFFHSYEEAINWVLDLNDGPEYEDFDEEDDL